ncbi:hypothetical protein OSH11_11590 [Kaistia dalseonensis]|uniref:Uncharacterized protein n=1 Tax=Kaistia dalseonensis TaxID=410840 RepID=A0ABU0H7R9_9HYPH|nr:hypothetical protein [Kaistia dalseonensis]MCX5495352.1 hypothetical protein [Kaistia dalseonensis]MDQ0437938.1 hypothetical protein [Kaistia dalseonensis]
MPQIDPTKEYQSGLIGPARRFYLVVPSDSADLPIRPRALYCSVAAMATMRDETGTEVPCTIPAGAIVDIQPVRILAAGYSGTLIALY